MSTSKLEAALDLINEKLPVFPVAAGKKSPPIKNWQTWATLDAKKVRNHWSVSPQDNIGIACGNGLLVLDVDGKTGEQSLAALEAIHGKLPETCEVSTPSGGRHLYFNGPDVSNTVGALGAGIDVRSCGGYVVGPGSTTAKGAYTVSKESEFAPAPSWLIDLCQKPREKLNKSEVVPDADTNTMQRASEWLAKQPAAVEGNGGDAHTYGMACSLRDLGISEAQVLELLSGEWNSRCAPPWSAAELRAKVKNAFDYAQNEAGSKTATVDDFPIIETITVAQTVAAVIEKAASKYPRVKRLSEIKIFAGNGNFVDGLCNTGELFQVIGAPGARKSQAAGWLAYCVARACPWFGRTTASGAVLYIAAERQAEQVKRFTVWARVDGLDPDALPIRIMGPGASFNDLNFARYVAQQAAALKADTGRDTRLIVIDTTMAVLPGLDINTAGVATQFGQNLKIITAQVPSAAIAAVHHTPKSGADTGMGSQGFDALFEATLVIEATEAGGSVRQIKGNTTRDWLTPFEWTGEGVQAEINNETYLAWKPKLCPVSAPQASWRKWKKDSGTDLAFTALCRLSPQNNPVAESAWRDACREFFGQGQRLQKNFYKAKIALEMHAAIMSAGEEHWQRRFVEASE